MNTSTDTDPRIIAVAQHTGYDADTYSVVIYGDQAVVTDGGAEYLVLTNEEAEAAAHEYAVGNLWAFNAQFLADYTDLPVEVFKALAEKFEDANEPILKLVERSDGGVDGLVDEAISTDGRGHFLADYDGEEVEAGEFYIYRVN